MIHISHFFKSVLYVDQMIWIILAYFVATELLWEYLAKEDKKGLELFYKTVQKSKSCFYSADYSRLRSLDSFDVWTNLIFSSLKTGRNLSGSFVILEELLLTTRRGLNQLLRRRKTLVYRFRLGLSGALVSSLFQANGVESSELQLVSVAVLVWMVCIMIFFYRRIGETWFWQDGLSRQGLIWLEALFLGRNAVENVLGDDWQNLCHLEIRTGMDLTPDKSALLRHYCFQQQQSFEEQEHKFWDLFPLFDLMVLGPALVTFLVLPLWF